MASANGRTVEPSFSPVRETPLPALLPETWDAGSLIEAAAGGAMLQGGGRLLRTAFAGGVRGVRVAERRRIDGLAIGAPVTAAFIGVMLAKGELAGAGPAGEDAAVSAARGVGLGEADAVTPGGPGSPVLDGQASEPIESGAGPQMAVVDPVSVGAPRAEAAPTASSSELAPAATPAAAAPGGEVTTGGIGAITVNVPGMAFGAGGILLAPVAASGDGLAPIGPYAGGTEGDDTLQGSDRNDVLEGGPGNDLISGLGGDDWLDGGSGDDTLLGGGGSDTLLGGSGQDQLDGGSGGDLLFGGDGADGLSGGDGEDVLDGGAGNDSLDGGSGMDQLAGGTGDDVLVVDQPDDLALENGYGADGGGRDALQVADGFGGATTFVFGDDLGVAIDGDLNARHQVSGGIEDLVLAGSAAHNAIGDGRDNSLVGNAGDNMLYGAAGNDILQGADGNDLLDGGIGADRLEGGSGDDILSGGLDADQLYGDAGDDTYVLGLHDSAVDTVFDHEGSNHVRFDGVNGEEVAARIVGDDLYLIVDDNPVGIVDGYVGHEDSFAGVDLGGELVATEDLLAAGGAGTASPEPVEDLLAAQLAQPETDTDPASDTGAEWLHGAASDDPLSGTGGTDGLGGASGGAGQDGAGLDDGAGSGPLFNGPEDDRYLLRSGDDMSTIRDAEGSNVVELEGFTGARLEGVVVGHDLIVVADHAPILTVEDYVGNEASFAGLQVDDTFVPTEDLFN